MLPLLGTLPTQLLLLELPGLSTLQALLLSTTWNSSMGKLRSSQCLSASLPQINSLLTPLWVAAQGRGLEH